MQPDNRTNEQIQWIKGKLANFKQMDQNFKTFDSRQLQFKLYDPLDSAEISAVEDKYKLKLPGGYAAFLNRIRNEGADTAYGVVELADTLYSDMDYRNEMSLINSSLPFTHTEPQIMLNEDGEWEELDEEELKKIESPAPGTSGFKTLQSWLRDVY